MQAITSVRNDARIRHAQFKPLLPQVMRTLNEAGYSIDTLIFLGEGAESLAYSIEDDSGKEVVLKISSPLLNGWQPDWGNRAFDALLFEVDGAFVHETECGCFWYLQEFAETFERAEEVSDELWQEFEDLVNRFAENLFLDDTGLIKQLGIVDREDGQHLVVVDYAAYSTQDFNSPL